MSERMRVNYLCGYTIFFSKVLELMGNPTRTNAFAKAIEKEITRTAPTLTKPHLSLCLQSYRDV